MAKRKGVKRWTSLLVASPRYMSIYTSVTKRRQNSLARQFTACAWISRPKGKGLPEYPAKRVRMFWQRQVCSYGKNPRQAIGRAVAKLGSNLQRRGGAFAAYKA